MDAIRDFLPGTFIYASPVEVVLRLCLALIAGFALGLDREMRHRKIGIRTYMIVSVGAASYSMITMELAVSMAGEQISADPTRITQGLIGAIGFLGAGAIIQGGGKVGGMATAASIWVAGAVGMASGLGYYFHAIFLAIIVALVLRLSRVLEGRGKENRPDFDG